MKKYIEKQHWAIKTSYKNGVTMGFCNDLGIPSLYTICFSHEELAKSEVRRIKADYPLLAKRVNFKVSKVEIHEVIK